MDKNLGLTPTLCEIPNKNIVATIGVVTIMPATFSEIIICGGTTLKSVMPNIDCNAQANIMAIKNSSNTPCKTAVLVFFDKSHASLAIASRSNWASPFRDFSTLPPSA